MFYFSLSLKTHERFNKNKPAVLLVFLFPKALFLRLIVSHTNLDMSKFMNIYTFTI